MEWINKSSYVHVMGYYKAVIVNKLQLIGITLGEQTHLYKTKTNLVLEVRIVVTFGEKEGAVLLRKGPRVVCWISGMLAFFFFSCHRFISC